jgi:hypothetical protein
MVALPLALEPVDHAIALIRKHTAGSRAAIEQFAQGHADVTATSGATGRVSAVGRYGPGTILDVLTRHGLPVSRRRHRRRPLRDGAAAKKGMAGKYFASGSKSKLEQSPEFS